MTLPEDRQPIPSRNEIQNEAIGGEKKPGRPRRWANDPEKHRQHRARRREREQLIEELLLAVRNADFDDPAKHPVEPESPDAATVVMPFAVSVLNTVW